MPPEKKEEKRSVAKIQQTQKKEGRLATKSHIRGEKPYTSPGYESGLPQAHHAAAMKKMKQAA